MVCNRCPHKCRGIGRGFVGFCGVVVVDDKGVRDKYPWMITAVTASIIEKVPLYHFYPGSWSVNIWLPGCPYTCKNCPWNAATSGEDAGRLYILRRTSVREIIDYCSQVGTNIVSIMGGEPLVQEWVTALLTELKNRDIRTVIRTTLTVSKNIIERINVDAVVVDMPLLAGSTPPIDIIFKNMEIIGKRNIHYELLLLIDKTSVLRWSSFIEKARKLDKEVPIHVQVTDDINWKTIKKMVDELEDIGFSYVYVVGDTSGEYSTTYCPHCKTPLIIRDEYGVRESFLAGNKCPKCGVELKIIGGLTRRKQRKLSRLFASGEKILWSP